jgi:CMP-N,N'-diacetyllegionaminic acid synthase
MSSLEGVQVVTKTYCFDIDGVICDSPDDLDYSKAIPKWKTIRKIRELVEQGHKIILYTARGSGTGKKWALVTVSQMSAWNVPYQSMYFGKPPADMYIDDKAISFEEWENEFLDG